jgi:diguanylate cyclase (GGDEF)-like protein
MGVIKSGALMTIHPTFLRLSAILPVTVGVLALIMFALEFDILAHGGPSKSDRQKLELEEINFVAALFSVALGVMALVNRRLMIREHKHRHLAELEATTDVLTGIANRRHFLRTAEKRVAEGLRAGEHCAILLVDLDRFKAINDAYGHAAGDAVLIAVAQRLDQPLPANHLAGRLGGDEFAIVLGPHADLRIEHCAEQIAARIGRPISYAGHDLSVGASIGIAVSAVDGHTAAALLAAADVRMYQRKRGGRRLEIVAAA